MPTQNSKRTWNNFFGENAASFASGTNKRFNPIDQTNVDTVGNLASGSVKGVAGAGAGLAALLNIKAVRKYFGLSNRKEVEQQIKDALKKAAKSKKSSKKDKSEGGKRRTYRRRRR